MNKYFQSHWRKHFYHRLWMRRNYHSFTILHRARLDRVALLVTWFAMCGLIHKALIIKQGGGVAKIPIYPTL
jgi:hypothetical protein